MTLELQRKKWERAIRRWQRVLMIDSFNIVIEYLGDDDEKLASDEELPSDSWMWAAQAEVKSMYLQARIKVTDEFLLTANNKDIDTKAAHELVHVLLGQISDFTTSLIEDLPKNRQTGYWKWWHQVNEFTTTHIARVIGAGNGS